MNLDNVVKFADPDEATGVRVQQPPNPPQPSQSALRSVRKRFAKPWKKAMPMQPVQPPPKVYRVDPINFREVVQQLTGAPEIWSHRLHSVAPPPLDLLGSPSHSDHTCKSGKQQQSLITREREGSSSSSSFSALMTPAQVNLSMNDDSLGPFSSSVSWPHFFPPILSPGTLASLEQSSRILY